MRSIGSLLVKYKLVTVAVVICIMILIFVSIGIYSAYKNSTKAHIHNTLETVLNLSNQAINSWASSEKSEALIWSQSSEVIEATKNLLKVRSSKENLRLNKQHDNIRRLLHPVILAKRYQGFFIVDLNGLNLSSMRDDNIGTRNLISISSIFFDEIFNGNPAISNPTKSDVALPGVNAILSSGLPTMFVGSPIKDGRGKIIAALLFRIDPRLDFSALLQRGRIRDTGETYAFDKQANLISESRFNGELVEIGLIGAEDFSTLTVSIMDPGVNLLEPNTNPKPRQQWPPTLMAASALAGHSSYNLEGYRDYRGVPVIGVWLWNYKMDLGLASEIDLREAFANVANLKLVILFILTILSALTIIIGAIFIRNQEAAEYIRETKGRREIIDGVLANISQGVVMFDPDKNLLVWNEQYAKFLKLSDENISHGVSNLELATLIAKRGFLGAGDPDEIARKRIDFLWSKDTTRQDVTYSDGHTYDIMTQKTPRNELVISYTDVSDRVSAEKESQKQQLELARLNQQKEQLFSIVSHDLKNAFNALIGFSRLLTDEYENLSKTKITEYISLINRSSRQAYDMMNNLLQWANTQMEGISVQSVRFSLGKLVEGELKTQTIFAQQKNITIESSIGQDKYAFADQDLVLSIVRNLLNNAIKFTPEHGEIKLYVEEVESWAKIFIQDTGVGMTAEIAASFFSSEISRSTNGTSGETGTGLGSLICGELVRMQGGDITVEKSDGTGTTISFTLPTMK